MRNQRGNLESSFAGYILGKYHITIIIIPNKYNCFKWLTRQKQTKYRIVYLVFKEMASENILTIKQNQICLLSNNSQNIEIQTG